MPKQQRKNSKNIEKNKPSNTKKVSIIRNFLFSRSPLFYIITYIILVATIVSVGFGVNRIVENNRDIVQAAINCPAGYVYDGNLGTCINNAAARCNPGDIDNGNGTCTPANQCPAGQQYASSLNKCVTLLNPGADPNSIATCPLGGELAHVNAQTGQVDLYNNYFRMGRGGEPVQIAYICGIRTGATGLSPLTWAEWGNDELPPYVNDISEIGAPSNRWNQLDIVGIDNNYNISQNVPSCGLSGYQAQIGHRSNSIINEGSSGDTTSRTAYMYLGIYQGSNVCYTFGMSSYHFIISNIMQDSRLKWGIHGANIPVEWTMFYTTGWTNESSVPTAGGAPYGYLNTATPSSYTPEIGQISSLVCTPASVAFGATVNCTVQATGAPAGLPYTGSVTVSINNGGGSVTCNFDASGLATCLNINSGNPGSNTATTNLGGSASITVASPTVITLTNIGNSTDCTDTKEVFIPQTYTCTFPLSGDANNFYALPAGGIVATTQTATGQSSACTIINNNTATAALECTVIPSNSGTVGVQNVLLSVAGGTPTDRGDVKLLSSPTVITASMIGNSTNCANGYTVFIGTTYTCDFPLSGSTNNTYAIPTNGITAATSTTKGGVIPVSGGQSPACVVVDNGTSTAILRCASIPTTGGTEGDRDVILTVNGAAPVDKGDVTLQIQDPNDLDGDGLTNDEETDLGTNPNNPDSDGDGIPDGIEVDNDGNLDNGFPDGGTDTDGDGNIDALDLDSDNDGIRDSIEKGTACLNVYNCVPAESSLDSDTVPNYRDNDSDGDGIWDLIEGDDANTNGVNDKGLIPNQNGQITAIVDVNDNGLADQYDTALTGVNPALQDTDTDGAPDYLDVDDDGDGINSQYEDLNSNGNFADDDTDRDGKPNYLDNDDDGDTVPTIQENADPNNDRNPSDARDTDGDRIPDYLDPINNPPVTNSVLIRSGGIAAVLIATLLPLIIGAGVYFISRKSMLQLKN